MTMNDDKKHAEVQKRIKACREKGKKKLDLSRLALEVIPPEIAELETLTELDITGYSITEIPEFIGNLVSLKRLSIGFTRSSPHDRGNITIPGSIGNLKKLRSLCIRGEKIAELPGEIGDCRTLYGLELECPQLKSLPSSFSNLKKLRKFSFSHCNFTTIPDYICGWTELEELIVSMDNTFQGPYTDLTKIPENIGNLKKLHLLKLCGTSIRKIPASLGECPLQQLEITGDFKTLPETFGKLSELEELELNAYKLRTLPESFGNLSSLKDLTMRTRGAILPETFGRLSSLQDLGIMDSKITALPESIGNCINLKRLYLDCDELRELPASIGNLKDLEQFSADVFNLKKIPDTIGNLKKLKRLSLFSGALTAFPESMGNLKKLKSISLDAYNVSKPPESFKNFTRVKGSNINIGRVEQEPEYYPRHHEKKYQAAVAAFKKLRHMHYQYRWKMLEKYSLKKIENILCSAPYEFKSTEIDKEIVNDILSERRRRLNRKFVWTPENIRRIVMVSDKFLAAWEEAFIKAKKMIDLLFKEEKDKDDFWYDYDVEIVLSPNIFVKDDETGEWYPDQGVYSILTDYISEWELTMNIGRGDYDPVTKDEKGFRENSHVNHDLSWNIEGFGDIELKDHYICYAIHILYSHSEWANEDILRINNINSEVRITRLYNEEEVF